MQREMVIFIAGAFSMLALQLLVGVILCNLQFRKHKPDDVMSGDGC
jgi:hypothetical protein